MRKLLFLILFACICTAVQAYDFAVKNADGKTIYYNYISKVAKTVEVTYCVKASSSYYVGVIVIPSTVNKDGVEYSVTRIGMYAFSNCSGLT